MTRKPAKKKRKARVDGATVYPLLWVLMHRHEGIAYGKGGRSRKDWYWVPCGCSSTVWIRNGHWEKRPPGDTVHSLRHRWFAAEVREVVR